MIIVKVELLSAITGRTTELARMHICNDGSSGNVRAGNYVGSTFRGRNTDALNKRVVSKVGEVKGWLRLDYHVWNLVRRMLEEMGYDKGDK